MVANWGSTVHSAYYFIELENHKAVGVQLEVVCDISTYCQCLTGGRNSSQGGPRPQMPPLATSLAVLNCTLRRTGIANLIHNLSLADHDNL